MVLVHSRKLEFPRQQLKKLKNWDKKIFLPIFNNYSLLLKIENKIFEIWARGKRKA